MFLFECFSEKCKYAINGPLPVSQFCFLLSFPPCPLHLRPRSLSSCYLLPIAFRSLSSYHFSGFLFYFFSILNFWKKKKTKRHLFMQIGFSTFHTFLRNIKWNSVDNIFRKSYLAKFILFSFHFEQIEFRWKMFQGWKFISAELECFEKHFVEHSNNKLIPHGGLIYRLSHLMGCQMTKSDCWFYEWGDISFQNDILPFWWQFTGKF